MTVKLRDTRALIATVRHDVRAGNLERARRWMAEFVDVPPGWRSWDEASPVAMEHVCQAVEAKLDEAGL